MQTLRSQSPIQPPTHHNITTTLTTNPINQITLNHLQPEHKNMLLQTHKHINNTKITHLIPPPNQYENQNPKDKIHKYHTNLIISPNSTIT